VDYKGENSATPGACTECGSHDIGGVCRSCGQVIDNARLIAIIEEQKEQFEALSYLLANARRTIKKLRKEEDQSMRKSELWPAVLRVLKKWAELCYPEARELQGGERARNVFERLRAKDGFAEEQLIRCAYGYSQLPYVVNGRRMAIGTPAQRRVDAELIYADPKRVADGLALADEADRRKQVLTPSSSPTSSSNGRTPSSQNGHLSELGTAAVEFAKRFGWQVFPVQPRGKKPVTEHGLLDATVDVARITAFWQLHPAHNVAIRCGIQSGIVVLDVDGEEGTSSLRALEAKYEKLPKTLSVVTPRGGQHFYFAHPGQGEVHNTTGFPGPGLDIRGDGGYVLGRPSVGANDRIYQVDEEAEMANIPMWLLTLLVEHESQRPLFSQDYTAIVAEGVRLGERNSQLTTLAGHWIAFGHSADETREICLLVNEKRCAPPLPNREVVKLVESIVKREKRKSQNTLREIVR